MSQQSETIEDKLERAVKLILRMESQVDILTMSKAITLILERRARKPAWQEWFCCELRDAEQDQPNETYPLEPDLS
jgi:hypothetical protein